MSGVVLLEKNTGVFTSIYSDGTGYSVEEKGNTIDIKM